MTFILVSVVFTVLPIGLGLMDFIGDTFLRNLFAFTGDGFFLLETIVVHFLLRLFLKEEKHLLYFRTLELHNFPKLEVLY